jgi:hypothetical protein
VREGRKEGREEEGSEGRKEEREKGRKERRKERRKKEVRGGRKEGREEGRERRKILEPTYLTELTLMFYFLFLPLNCPSLRVVHPIALGSGWLCIVEVQYLLT